MIEIVGDSITSGLGNRTADGTMHIRPDEEDGWMSYAALAARELGCEWSIVSESGIEVSRPEKPFFDKHGMEEIYAYTDELYQRQYAAQLEKWDFAAHPNDVVVLNLGTNRFYPALGLTIDDIPAMEAHFQRQYGCFFRMVRALNGPNTLIVCTLGPMDYYLWDRLRDAVEEYQRETGDSRVILFKFVGIRRKNKLVIFQFHGSDCFINRFIISVRPALNDDEFSVFNTTDFIVVVISVKNVFFTVHGILYDKIRSDHSASVHCTGTFIVISVTRNIKKNRFLHHT